MAPEVTLHGTLTDISGAPNAGYVVITLINFGCNQPEVNGTSIISDVEQRVQAAVDGTWSVQLWSNSQITPANTLYEIAVYPSSDTDTAAETSVAKFKLDTPGTYDLVDLIPAITVLPPASHTPVVRVNGKSGYVMLGAGDVPGLATVASSGSYNDLTGKPDLSALGVNADWNAVSGKAQILNKPTVVTLDGGGHVPMAQLPAAIQSSIYFAGLWNATTNTPTITSGQGYLGQMYKVSAAGSTLVDGNSSWHVGDWIVYDGAAWDKIDNFEAVTSVAGRVGDVTLTSTDVSGLAASARTDTTNASNITTGTLSASLVANIAESQVTNLVSDLALKAPLASPSFTGTVSNAGQLMFNGSTGGAGRTVDITPSGTDTNTLIARNSRAGSIAVYGYNTATSGTNYGVQGVAASNTTGTAYGVFGSSGSANSGTSYGLYGQATGTGTGTNIGGSFSAAGAAHNYALIIGSGNVGIGTATPGALLDVNGAATALNTNNYSSGALNLTGNFWTGAASASDYWSVQTVLGAGANPTSTLTFTHSGTSGAASVALPAGSLNASAVSGYVPNIQITTATTAVAANSVSSVYTVSMPGLLATSTLTLTPSSDISATAGWSTGALYFVAWPTAGQLNYRICNGSAGSITPAAVTWNVSGK